MQGSERQRAASAPEPRGQPLAIGCRPEPGSLPRERARAAPGETNSVCFPACSRMKCSRVGLGRTRSGFRRFSKTRQVFASRSLGVRRRRTGFRQTRPSPGSEKTRTVSRRRVRGGTGRFIGGGAPMMPTRPGLSFSATRTRRDRGVCLRAAGSAMPTALPGSSGCRRAEKTCGISAACTLAAPYAV